MVERENEDFPLWVGCGVQNGDKEEFHCFIEPSSPFVRNWIKKIDTTARVESLAKALASILACENGIRDIRWVADKN
jgi:hypothetical protein